MKLILSLMVIICVFCLDAWLIATGRVYESIPELIFISVMICAYPVVCIADSNNEDK